LFALLTPQGKKPGWHWKELEEDKKVRKAADAEAQKLGKKQADVYPATARSMRLAAEKALEAKRQAHLTMKKETWQVVRKARDHKLANNSRANRWGEGLRNTLEQHLQLDKSMEYTSGGFCYHIVSGVTPVLRQSVHGFDFDEQSLYYRISVSIPRAQNKLVKFLQTTGVTIDGAHHVWTDAEMGNAELDYDLQFLVENNLAGQSWITLPANTYKITTGPVPAEMMGRVGEPEREFEADKMPSSRSGSDKSSDGGGGGGGDTDAEMDLLNRLGPEGRTSGDGAPKKKRVRTVVGYEAEHPGDPAGGDIGFNARKTWYRAEIDINYKSLISHYREKGKWERILPLRTVSFDIECHHGDTQVAIDGGLSMCIKDIKPGTKVLAYDPVTKGLVPRTVTHHLPRGDKECIELLFNDGRKIICTPDHKILTTTGEFVEANRLVVGETQVTASIEYPSVLPDEDAVRCQNWSLDTTDTLGYELNMTNRRTQALAFARLLGWLVTDGNSSVRGSHAGCSTLFVGHELDRRTIFEDIKSITGFYPSSHVDKGLIHVSIQNELHRAFQATGAKYGAKVDQLNDIPAFLTDANCPLPLVREFLGALFGGNGSTVCLGRSGDDVLYSPISFTVSKKGSCVKEQYEIVKTHLFAMLERCNIPTEGIYTFPTEVITKKNRPEDVAARKAAGEIISPTLTWNEAFKPDVTYAINVDFPASACLPFLHNVGFRYCCHKQMRLTAACAYWRQGKLVNEQRVKICDRVTELLAKPDALSFPKALKQAKIDEALETTLHPLVVEWSPHTQAALHTQARHSLINRRESLIEFDTAKFFSPKRKKRKYSAFVRGQEIAATAAAAAAGYLAPAVVEDDPANDSVMRYGVHKDAISFPTFRVKLVAKRAVGVHTVYDLSVPVPEAPEGDDTWDSFTANGIVVHNCAAQKKGRFPVANPKDANGLYDLREGGDPVISISVVLQKGDDKTRSRKAVLIWKLPQDRYKKDVHIEDPDDIDMQEQDCEVWMYRDERDMLTGFAEFMRSCQPSVLVSYNGNNFDVPYLIDRGIKLDMPNFPFWSPIKELVTIKASTFQSKAAGVQNRLDPIVPGVLVFDLCRFLISTEKFSSYTLNAVAAKIIGKTKSDLHHCLDPNTRISLANGTSKTIKDLAGNRGKLWALDSESADDPHVSVSNQTNWFDQGTKQCVEVLLEDGKTIKCTPDHRIWAKQALPGEDEATWRWVPAGQLQKGTDRVAVSFSNPLDTPGADEADWTLQVGVLSFSMSTDAEREKVLAFCRILGGLFARDQAEDVRGMLISISTNTSLDAQRVADDIQLVCGQAATYCTEQQHTVDLPDDFRIEIGNLEIETDGTPKFLLSSTCPTSVLREFTSAYLGYAARCDDPIAEALSGTRGDHSKRGWRCGGCTGFANEGHDNGVRVSCANCGAVRSDRSLFQSAQRAKARNMAIAGEAWRPRTREEMLRKHAKTARYQATIKASSERHKVRYKALLKRFSHEETGMCCKCKHLPAGEIDHMRQELKEHNMSELRTQERMDKEIARNTVDGVCYLQSLCKDCHYADTQTRLGPRKEYANGRRERLEFVNSYKRSIGKCQYADCKHPQDLCTKGNEGSFHMDHIHPTHCVCKDCERDPTLRKVAIISDLWQNGPVDVLLAELVPRKVRLMHGDCHKNQTETQHLLGELFPRRALISPQVTHTSVQRFLVRLGVFHSSLKVNEAGGACGIVVHEPGIVSFQGDVGVRYNHQKSFELGIGASFQQHKTLIAKQHAYLIDKADRKAGISDAKQAVLAANPRASSYALCAEMRQFLLMRMTEARVQSIAEANLESAPAHVQSIPVDKHVRTALIYGTYNWKPTPCPKQFLDKIGACPSVDEGPPAKRVRMDQSADLPSTNSNSMPTVAMRVISVKDAGMSPVYDISVEEKTSFVANGVVVHNSLISTMFYGTKSQRRRLCVYNIVDSSLPLQIITKLKINYALAEIARVCGVCNTTLLTKGQGIKTESQLHRLMLQHGLVAPILPHTNKKEIDTMEEMIESEAVKYEGAICVEPKTGLYQLPISTLDFASLYPVRSSLRQQNHSMYPRRCPTEN
jgi:DNA polymerase elongation subunit (family B)